MKKLKKKRRLIIISFVLFIVAIILEILERKYDLKIISNVLFVISYLIVGYPILKKAIKNIFRGKIFDENFLMAIATIGAFIIGEFPEAVAVMLFYQIGELFQSYAVNKSRKSISNLMNIRPDYANIKRNEKIDKVNPEEVNVGEIIVIKPGEKIPLDGIVINGSSFVDTSNLTGESIPRKVEKKDIVLSGCINKEGVLEVEVTKKYKESTVSKILDLVENASSRKSKSENFISKFAKYYTPIVVIIALIISTIPPIIIKDTDFSGWIYKALTFLVVSCPCALVISIPLGFFGGIGGASKIGILVKGSNYLEALSNVETIVFDKTGTLTKGVFEVQKISCKGLSDDELLEMCAHIEHFSNHPIALSIKKAYKGEIYENKINGLTEYSGRGIEANYDGKNVIIGNEQLMNEKNISFTKCEEIGTVLYVAIDNVFVGFILISDEIKKDSKNTMDVLKKMNIKKLVMLTGDKKEIGEDIGKKLEMDNVYTQLLPDEKVKEIEKLMKEKTNKGKVVFVGDGINDSPVLAISDIGIAMGAVGSDSAIEAADIVIMTDEISKIVDSIKISKKTMRIVKENIIFAIMVKILVLLLTLFGLSTMWMAVFADVGVSIIAIINSLRMLNVKN